MEVEELRASVASGAVDTVVVAFCDMQGRLLGKRVAAPFFIDSIDDGTHACDYLLTTDMDMTPVEGYGFANWERGYGDVHLRPDLATLRTCGWLEGSALVLCDVADPVSHELVDVAPRSMLRKQIDTLADLGLHALAASELEFYLFDDSYRDAHGKGYRGLAEAGWYIEDYHLLHSTRYEGFLRPVRAALEASGIPVESTKGEFGVGQHEINIRYAPILDMADRHVVLKHAMKAMADSHERSLTFMAKPDADQAGSSCHIHLSLVTGDGSAPGGTSTGENAFERDGELTDTFRWFLGGWMAHAADLMAFYAPTINSYKRFQSQSWAPTALAWSTDNRTAGFRIVGTGSARRIECRIPGADVNPYLAYSAALASGLDGIRNRIEPPPEFRGDAYAAADLPHVAANLRDASSALAASSGAREWFGAEVVEHYGRYFTTQLASFDAAVTDWERREYFERI